MMPTPVPRRPRAALAALVGLVALWAGTWLVNRSLIAVRGPSMLPTLSPGERLLAVPVGGRRLRVGDLVVVEDPGQPGHLVVKRVAGLQTDGGAGARVLVLGDNPGSSTDGRHWGPVPRSAVRRVVVARWPSLTRVGGRYVSSGTTTR